MSNRPVGDNTGIFTLLFREVGLFSEQTWQWVNERARESQKYVEERARDTQKYLEDQARDDRTMLVDDDKRRLAEAETRKAEAEARLLEQVRLAKQAGLDVEAILRRTRS